MSVEEITIAPLKPNTTIDVVESIDIRVGTIQAVEEVPGSHKLMRLKVDFGDHTRNILAGIKGEREHPQEIAGKQALFVLNLEPRKMMGELSEGMLFDIGFSDNISPALAMPERPIPNGARAG